MSSRPFKSEVLLKEMLSLRESGWTYVALQKKYGLRSHRTIVYHCFRNHVICPKRFTTALYRKLRPFRLLTSARNAVKNFPLIRANSLGKERLVSITDWWAVEQSLRYSNFESPILYSKTFK